MKIDFHIHTVANEYLDPPFNYNSDLMKAYISSNNFEGIAITNHNLFDENNFNKIKEDLKKYNIVILPGIEISLEEGHILVIGDDTEEYIKNLKEIAYFISNNEKSDHYKMSLSDFNDLVCNKNFLLIPHYKKDPSLSSTTLEGISDSIKVGEADSVKHFLKMKKDNALVPVFFSDIRIGSVDKIESYQNKSRFTYLKCDNRCFNAIKDSLENINFVSISQDNSEELFDILGGRCKAFNGINVLLGERSSGKTYTLDHLSEDTNNSTLYIKQFEITKECSDNDFPEVSKNNEQKYVAEYCRNFVKIFDYIDNNVIGESTKLSGYVESLLNNAKNSISDFYSKLSLFNYNPYSTNSSDDAAKLCSAVITLLDAKDENKILIDKYVSRDNLLSLLKELIYSYRQILKSNKIKEQTNKILKSISDSLGLKSSVVQIQNIDFNVLFKERYIRFKFNRLINGFKEKSISEEFICEKFWKEIKLFRQKNKSKLKSALGVAKQNTVDYLVDIEPFDAYLKAKEDTNIKTGMGEYRYRYFLDFSVHILSKNKKDISGGQRAEYILLNKLYNYQKYELVLIDEMESSFDNPFLNSEIITILRKISEKCVVFISTHNNNLGVSLKPDFYIYHLDSNGVYEQYFGKSNDEFLINHDGKKIKLSELLLSTMEASPIAYKERNKKYESIKD